MGRATVPSVLGAATLGASSRERVICSCGCGNIAVADFDAIGNIVYRCPTRRRKVPTRAMAPEHAFVPVRLVRQSDALAAQLPAIEPGQLRCQRCARGVDGNNRQCNACRRLKRAQLSRDGRRRKRPAMMVITCDNCGNVRPRKGGIDRCRTCPRCAPVGTRKGRIYKAKPCQRCGRPFIPTGPRAKFHPGGCP